MTTVAPGDLAARYERAADFTRLMLDHDPAGKMRNAFVNQVFPGLG